MKIENLLKTIINIEGKQYYPSKKRPKLGQLVLDKKDGMYGICDMIGKRGNRTTIAIKHENVAEVGVPINRVYSLVLKTKQQSL